MADQLSFDWPTGVALGPDDFFVSEANAQAYAMTQDPSTWPERKLVIAGPAGSGKSHLARIVQTHQGGMLVASRDIAPDFRTDNRLVIVEDMEALHQTAEEALFHLHNHLRNIDGTLLMTARTPPSRWPIVLPDLASRMHATTLVQITDPDDALLQALIMKLFADRQINPKPPLVAYLASRIERSFAAAADIVARLDDAGYAQGRKINKQLAADLLDKSG